MEQTPLKLDEKRFLDFALSEFTPNDPIKAKKLQDTFENIKNIMNQSGNFYAYNYYTHSTDWVGDIDFFILSPS